jgi:hypothetical protein
MSTAFYPGAPPTRLLSWQQLVLEADPNWRRLSLQPWAFDFSNGRLFVDWLPVYNFPDFGAGLASDGGVLVVTDATGWPTSPVGLSAGAVWSNGGDAQGNGGTVNVVPGMSPSPSAEVQLFGQITAAQLLALGGGNMPLVQPNMINQIWNVGDELQIVFGPTYLESDGGLLILQPGAGWPSGTTVPGGFYSDGGAAAIAPGGSPIASPPVFFGQLTAQQLLALGGDSLPLTAPAYSGQLYNSGNQVVIA